MSLLKRQTFMTLAELAGAVISQVTLNQSDYNSLLALIQNATTAAQTAYPSASLYYATFSYQLASGQWVRQFEIRQGLDTPGVHWLQAVQVNMIGSGGNYYAVLSSAQTFVYSNGSALGDFTPPVAGSDGTSS
jgi:hypothetical protein